MSPLTELITGAKAYGWSSFSDTSIFRAITTATVTGAGTQVITFSNIPQIFSHLQIRVFTKTNYANPFDSLLLKMGNGSIDTGTNYTRISMSHSGTSSISNSLTINADHILFSRTNGSTGTGNHWAAAMGEIIEYSSTNKNKVIRSYGGNNYGTSASSDQTFTLCGGMWRNTSAVDTLRIEAQNNTFVVGSTFSLYGIVGNL